MRNYLFVIIICGVASLQSCKNNAQSSSLLTKAESLLTMEPDSADIYLGEIDASRLRGENQARYYLLRTMVDAKLGRGMRNDSLIRPAYKYYLDKSDHGKSSNPDMVKYFVQSSIYMGDFYAQQDSMKQCEEKYRQAVKYAERCEDWHSLYCSLSRLARQKSYVDAEEALRLAERGLEVYGKCEDDDINYISLLNDAANYSLLVSHFSSEDYSKATGYANKEYEYSRQNNIPEGIRQSQILLANIHCLKGDYPEALEYAKQAYDAKDKSESSIVVRTILAECYLMCDSVLQAKELYLDATHSNDIETQYVAYKGLGELMLGINEPDSAVAYYDKAFECEEGIYFKALETKENYYKEIVKQEKEKEEWQYRTKLRIILLICSFLFLLIISLLAARYFILQLRLHKERRLSTLKKSKYELERHLLEEKNLSQEKQLLSDNIRKKEDLIKALQARIYERIDIIKKINDKRDSHITLTRKDWLDIENLLDVIDDHSISKVRSKMRNLTEEDIRLCMLVRLRMSNPSIGNIYGISVSAVQHRKQKLKKEGFGVTDPSITLEKAIVSI